MKKRLHDKKAGIAILLALIVVSVAEMIFRTVVLKGQMINTTNLGEQLSVVVLAVTILILTAKGLDRACYICYGAWAGYFILDQLFELPGVVIEIVNLLASREGVATIPVIAILGPVARILTMIGIIIIGVLLVEYINDGTIYNRAFNVVCIFTIFMLLCSICSSILGGISGITMLFLETFNSLYRLTMVFMFTFFAYDSAKNQLKKTDLTK